MRQSIGSVRIIAKKMKPETVTQRASVNKRQKKRMTSLSIGFIYEVIYKKIKCIRILSIVINIIT